MPAFPDVRVYTENMIAGPAERVASITASHAALRDAVAVARLAPSSHNSQPWALASFESADAVRGLGP